MSHEENIDHYPFHVQTQPDGPLAEQQKTVSRRYFKRQFVYI